MTKLKQDMLDCIKDLTAVVEEVLPQMGHIVLQDYGRLNRALMASARILNEAKEG